MSDRTFNIIVGIIVALVIFCWFYGKISIMHDRQNTVSQLLDAYEEQQDTPTRSNSSYIKGLEKRLDDIDADIYRRADY